MTRLEEATKRLEQAIARLESAADAGSTGGSKPANGVNGDSALRAELDAARQEQSELQAVTEEVSQRLDTVIDRLQKVLEN